MLFNRNNGKSHRRYFSYILIMFLLLLFYSLNRSSVRNTSYACMGTNDRIKKPDRNKCIMWTHQSEGFNLIWKEISRGTRGVFDADPYSERHPRSKSALHQRDTFQHAGSHFSMSSEHGGSKAQPVCHQQNFLAGNFQPTQDCWLSWWPKGLKMYKKSLWKAQGHPPNHWPN